jgi:hypothetical protein
MYVLSLRVNKIVYLHLLMMCRGFCDAALIAQLNILIRLVHKEQAYFMPSLIS